MPRTAGLACLREARRPSSSRPGFDHIPARLARSFGSPDSTLSRCSCPAGAAASATAPRPTSESVTRPIEILSRAAATSRLAPRAASRAGGWRGSGGGNPAQKWLTIVPHKQQRKRSDQEFGFGAHLALSTSDKWQHQC
jgi:hypothetical protein